MAREDGLGDRTVRRGSGQHTFIRKQCPTQVRCQAGGCIPLKYPQQFFNNIFKDITGAPSHRHEKSISVLTRRVSYLRQNLTISLSLYNI